MWNWLILSLQVGYLGALGAVAWRRYPAVVVLYAVIFAGIGYASIKAL